MKRSLYLLFLLIGTASCLFPCTYVQNSFCSSSYTYPEDLLLAGKIVHVDTNGINLEVIEVLSGSETRDTIRIWDIPDVECNETWPMSASEMGDLNDSILVSMSLIDSIVHPWDVIGDYRRPKDLALTRYLKFSKDSVYGFISGYVYAQTSDRINSMEYSAFKDYFSNNAECQSLVNISEASKEQSIRYFPNPVESVLKIHIDNKNNEGTSFEVFSSNGKMIFAKVNHSNQVEIDFSQFASGLYFVRVQKEGFNQNVFKVIKE